MTLALVLVGGMLGAPLRYVTQVYFTARHGNNWPWGTLTVNVVGSAVLGATAGAVAATDGPSWLLVLVGTGFCGALTTFSTFGVETVWFLHRGAVARAAAYALVSITLGLAACAGGWALATAIAQV